MGKFNLVEKIAYKKSKTITNVFVENTKNIKIRNYLILIIFVSIFFYFISNFSFFNSKYVVVECPIHYGCWSEWQDPTNYRPDWDSLTHISYFSWGLNPDGSLTNPHDINQYYTVRDLIHKNGKIFTITVLCGDTNTIDNVLANHQKEFANTVLNVLQKYGADGVNLDFEFPPITNTVTGANNKVLYENLLSTLHNTLKTANPNYEITTHVCAAPYPNADVAYCATNSNLSKYLDYIIVCEYDYLVGFEKTGSNSPFKDSTAYSVDDSLNDWQKYYPKSQLVACLPLYGYKYQASSNQKGATVINWDQANDQISMIDAVNAATKYGRLWDSNSNTPWCRYQVGSQWYQIWCDDEESLKLKYDYIKSQNIGGVGFFTLGLETPTLWFTLNNETMNSSKNTSANVPVASFTASTVSGTTKSFIKFNDISTNKPTSWAWNFDDGTTATTSSVSHRFTKAGKYTVSLTVGNTAGSATAKKNVTIRRLSN